MVLSYPVLRHYNISHKDSFDKKSTALAGPGSLLRLILLLPTSIRSKISVDGRSVAPRPDEDASDRVSFDDWRHPSDG
jgi:hypothetical protein